MVRILYMLFETTSVSFLSIPSESKCFTIILLFKKTVIYASVCMVALFGRFRSYIFLASPGSALLPCLIRETVLSSIPFRGVMQPIHRTQFLLIFDMVNASTAIVWGPKE